jgi:protein phosphatase
MVACKGYLIVFGGNLKNNVLANDLWVYSIADNEWKQVEIKEGPPSRVYATAAVCKSGKAKGMIMLYGGRGEHGIPLNDNWGLRRHRDGSWDWVK